MAEVQEISRQTTRSPALISILRMSRIQRHKTSQKPRARGSEDGSQDSHSEPKGTAREGVGVNMGGCKTAMTIESCLILSEDLYWYELAIDLSEFVTMVEQSGRRDSQRWTLHTESNGLSTTLTTDIVLR